MPRVVGRFGAAAARIGPAGWLARANAQRNPRRTAATSAALLIGVTLVVTMSTGAATARHSLDVLLDAQYPVDMQAYTLQSTAAALDDSALSTMAGVAGVSAVVPVRATTAQGPEGELTVYGVDPELARTVLNDEGLADALEQGSAVVPEGLTGPGGLELTAGGRSITLPVVGGWSDGGQVLVPLADLG